MLKNILKNKQIRKKIKSNFKFLEAITKKDFNQFFDVDCLDKNICSLINDQNGKKTAKIVKKLGKPGVFNFFLLIYFLLGTNYINNSNLSLSENELISLVPYFMTFRKNRSHKKKKIKLKKVGKVTKINNIIRINLEDI